MIPIEDLTDVTLAIEDTDEDDEEGDLGPLFSVTRRSRSDSRPSL